MRRCAVTRLAEWCSDAGLIVEHADDGWRDRLHRRSSEMVLVARKE
jgi:hypothetical protein